MMIAISGDYSNSLVIIAIDHRWKPRSRYTECSKKSMGMEIFLALTQERQATLAWRDGDRGRQLSNQKRQRQWSWTPVELSKWSVSNNDDVSTAGHCQRLTVLGLPLTAQIAYIAQFVELYANSKNCLFRPRLHRPTTNEARTLSYWNARSNTHVGTRLTAQWLELHVFT